MELVDLGHLPFVVETGSVSSGAQSLGMKPSTISKRIMRLEDELTFSSQECSAGHHLLGQAKRPSTR